MHVTQRQQPCSAFRGWRVSVKLKHTALQACLRQWPFSTNRSWRLCSRFRDKQPAAAMITAIWTMHASRVPVLCNTGIHQCGFCLQVGQLSSKCTQDVHQP